MKGTTAPLHVIEPNPIKFASSENENASELQQTQNLPFVAYQTLVQKPTSPHRMVLPSSKLNEPTQPPEQSDQQSNISILPRNEYLSESNSTQMFSAQQNTPIDTKVSEDKNFTTTTDLNETTFKNVSQTKEQQQGFNFKKYCRRNIFS